MTNLLKKSLTQDVVVKLPAVNFDVASSKAVVSKFLTYFGKVRNANHQEYKHNEVLRLSSNFKIDGMKAITYTELTDELGTADTMLIIDGIGHVIRKAVKRKTKLPSQDKLNEIFRSVSYLKLTNNKGGQVIFAVLDDAHFDIKVDEQTQSYFKRGGRSKNTFGIVTYSAFELMVEAGTCKSHFIFRYWDIYPYLKENYESAIRFQMNRRYGSNSGKLIATIRDNKKYQDTVFNRTTIFNQLGFKEIEIDTQKYDGTEFDYQEFKKVEKDWEKICNLVPHTDKVPALKFRKLGKHKADGLYVPALNIMAVDVRNTSSFIHEYGHYLDFCLGTLYDQLSTKKNFAPILEGYINGLMRMKLPEGFKFEYFTTPTEVFARSFELWVHNKIDSTTTLTKTDAEYYLQLEYDAFSKLNLLEMVYSYFDELFTEHSGKYVLKVINYGSERRNIEPTNIGEQLVLDLF
ncbi:TPA: hypothetical protein ACGOR8_001953 [Streptococcus suis]